MRKLNCRATSLGAAALLAAAAWLAATGAASAAEHEIRMRNKGEAGIMMFEPDFLQVAPGDTVHFPAVDKGHNAASIDGMVLKSGATWTGGPSRGGGQVGHAVISPPLGNRVVTDSRDNR